MSKRAESGYLGRLWGRLYAFLLLPGARASHEDAVCEHRHAQLLLQPPRGRGREVESGLAARLIGSEVRRGLSLRKFAEIGRYKLELASPYYSSFLSI